MKRIYELKGVYGKEGSLSRDRVKKSLKIISDLCPKSVLDVGCGVGFFSEKLKNRLGIEVYGIDISRNALNVAKKRGIKCKYANLDKSIPFKNEKFDLVFCGEIIEHLEDPDHLLIEIRRVLKPEGHLVLSTPNLAAWYNRIILLFGIQPIFSEVSSIKNLGKKFEILGQGSQPVGHLRIFTLRGIKDVLKLHNFEILEIKGFAVLPFLLINNVDRFFCLFPSLSSGFVIVGKKHELYNRSVGR